MLKNISKYFNSDKEKDLKQDFVYFKKLFNDFDTNIAYINEKDFHICTCSKTCIWIDNEFEPFQLLNLLWVFYSGSSVKLDYTIDGTAVKYNNVFKSHAMRFDYIFSFFNKRKEKKGWIKTEIIYDSFKSPNLKFEFPNLKNNEDNAYQNFKTFIIQYMEKMNTNNEDNPNEATQIVNNPIVNNPIVNNPNEDTQIEDTQIEDTQIEENGGKKRTFRNKRKSKKAATLEKNRSKLNQKKIKRKTHKRN